MTPTRAQLKEIRASIVGPLTIPKNGDEPTSERDVHNALAIALRGAETLLEKSNLAVLEKSAGDTATQYRKACEALHAVFGYLVNSVIPPAALPDPGGGACRPAAVLAMKTSAEVLALSPGSRSKFFWGGGRILR